MIRRPKNPLLLKAAQVLAVACFGSSAAGQLLLDEVPDQARGVVVQERLGQQIDLVAELRNSSNQVVRVGDYFNQKTSIGKPKPVVFTMVYYTCPIVCPVTLDKLTEMLKGVDYTVGEDYNVVIVSFNPEEGSPDSASAKEIALASYGRAGNAVRDGFTFHTASEVDARQVARSIGFNYRKLPNGEYSHPVSTVILTPDGTISRYLHGLDNRGEAFDLKLALLEATEGKIGKSLGDALLFTCFRYDPLAGAYSVQAMMVMKIGAVLTVGALTLLIGTLRLREIALRRKQASQTNQPKHATGGPEPAAVS